MDKSDLLSMIDVESRSSKTKPAKRKWREIEAIHDRQRLRQELSELGLSPEDELELL
ncbi:MAG: DUF3545 family protein [Paraglaciecola sp.]|jgi:hypothetical protein|nr:DUF3545 family protein [Paraglaciecola sp.]NCT48235.1 DUF3545 family protein [Paraglaciecola sp.]